MKTAADTGTVKGKRQQVTKLAIAYDLRRSFGNRWARVIMPVELKMLMRHKSIETTMEYYLDLPVRDVRSMRLAASRNQTSNQVRLATSSKNSAVAENP